MKAQGAFRASLRIQQYRYVRSVESAGYLGNESREYVIGDKIVGSSDVVLREVTRNVHRARVRERSVVVRGDPYAQFVRIGEQPFPKTHLFAAGNFLPEHE